MGKIVVSQNVTLNGVVEDPSGEGGFKHGGWFVQFMGQDWEASTRSTGFVRFVLLNDQI